MTNIDKEGISAVYEAVRNDSDETTWLTVKKDGPKLVLADQGTEYDAFLSTLNDDEPIFAYVRITTGDELSKRAKFALITWAAPGASALKKAKLSVDKTSLKNVVKSFAVEILADERADVKLEAVKETLMKAGGANYGTGSR